MKLPEVVVTERDATMFEMKKQGLTYKQIGRALQVSEKTAYRGCKRISDKIIAQLAVDHGQEFIVDLQRIEGMIASFLPLTRGKKIPTPDGDEVEIPPNIDAANMVLKLMAQKAKMLGFDSNSGGEMNINIGSINTAVANMPVVSSSKEDDAVERSPEEEAKHLFQVLKEAGVIDDDAFKDFVESSAVVIDAEVVDEDGEPAEIDLKELEEINIEAPEFVDEYDDEDEGGWSP
ncbi:MAG: helix-turn-helix transcriptional regulator [bacterium]